MNVTIPHQPFNTYMKDGTVGAKINKVVESIKPEAIYFTSQGGKRGAVVIVDLPDTSKIPSLVEPWFLTFEANVKLEVAMTPDDLKKGGLDALAKTWI